ncbi:hypothetical protein [Streptomyces sp. NPDC046821]|uniref:WXG100-like domain-containing protein n=1 Tax=Streptomyces sp. NPDC046821 TaxID=3154702 RepID=UPI0033E7B7B4
MGYTIPGWLDDVLDFIGINFPNVDEDDYREMATAMREFAEKFEGHGGDAHKAFSRILSSSEGWAVDSMEKHWNKIKASHLEKLPELARLFADACDTLAEIIFWMKTKAEAELALMAAYLGLSIGLAWATGGLSALLGAAEIQAMRQAVKRIIDEAVDRIVDEVLAKLTAPVNAKLEAMVEDMVLDLADGAFHMPAAKGSAGGGHGGKGGMHLDSAGDSGSGPGKVTRIDHGEFEDGAGKVSRHGSDMQTAASDPLGGPGQGRVRSQQGPRPVHESLRQRAARRDQGLRESPEEDQQAHHRDPAGAGQGRLPHPQGQGPRRPHQGEQHQRGQARRWQGRRRKATCRQRPPEVCAGQAEQGQC